MTKHDKHDEPAPDAPKPESEAKDASPPTPPSGDIPAPRITPIRPPQDPAALMGAIKRTLVSVAVAGGLATVVLVTLWKSFFHYVPPGYVLVVVAKTGEDLPPGQLLAKAGQKGIQEEVLGEGRHFVMPVVNEVQQFPAVEIGPGEVGIVTASIGKDLPEGAILAEEGEKGRRRKILAPGRHRLNPYAYKVEKKPRVEIPPGDVGFVTALVGKEMPAGAVLAQDGEKGPRAKVLSPGIYYLNPYELHVEAVEVGINQVSFLDVNRVAFPSSDAFPISLEATVEWELAPASVPPVMREFGSRGAIEQKIIEPQSKSIGRLEGSLYAAKDFLLGEGREKFQTAFTERLQAIAREKNIEVHSAFIRHIDIPANLLKPIQETFVSVQKEKTAKFLEETKKSAAQLEGEKALIKQREVEVASQTDALATKINAQAGQDVGKIEAETRRLVAEKQQAIAQLDAQRTLALGEANATVQKKLGESRAQLFGLKVGAFGGDAAAYRRYVFADSLPADLAIRLVQSGPGTLWTDLGTAGIDEAAKAKLLKGTLGADRPEKAGGK